MRTKEFAEKWCRGIRPALRLIVFASIFFLVVTPPVHADDKNECTQGSLKGSFGYALEGLRFPSPPSPVGVELVGAAGLLVFDGVGGLAAQDTFRTASGSTGAIARRTGTGTYTVDSNCTGSGEIGGDYGGLSFYFAIFSRGREFAFIVTNPGTDQIGLAMTTGDEECTLASFKGTYANVRFHDYRAPFFSTVNAGLEFGIVDGKGNISFPPVVQSTNGVFSHPTASGTYTVTPNCTYTQDFVIVDGATSRRAQREGVIVDGGNQVWGIGTTPTNLLLVGFARLKRISRHGEDD
jgi:hypothetical protein